MFWGLILEPNKRYAQTVERPFHISQAAMDTSTGDNEPCQVMVVVDGKNFLICTLQKNKTIQVPLDLYFKAGTSMAFLTNGKCNIHLTGYLDPEFDEELSGEEEEEEEEEEVPALIQTKNKRKLENSNDLTASKKPKQDKKAVAAAAEESSDEEDDDDDDDDQLKKILDGQDISTDENDESFKFNSQDAIESDDAEESDADEDDDEEDDEGDEDDTKNKSTDAETTLDTSKDSQVDMSKLSKSQKRRLKKKLQKQKEQPQLNGVDKSKKEKDNKKKEQPQKDKKEQKEKKKEAKKEQADKETVAKKEKKTLSGGVSVEDVKLGDGQVAKPGKTVLVYYEGRLKQNNKMFDNCIKGPGFKFRLGAKEVISGWDIGVNGMKVGGKRKIVCPPAMAYGAKGSPPVIPPNSTLVFEVELKDVK